MTATLKHPALDPMAVEGRRRTMYPEPFRRRVAGREKRALGDALGLGNFGVNLVKLEPGAQSALRHWHSKQDEFVWVLRGELTLVTNSGAQILTPGMCAGFPAGKADGHHLVNRSDAEAWYLEVGDRSAGDAASYPDDDLAARLSSAYVATHKDGRPY